jgi:hypothetical protein
MNSLDELKQLTDELTFIRQFLDEAKAKELKKDLEEIKNKLNHLKISVDIEELEVLKENLKFEKEELQKIIEYEKKVKETIEENKKYALNVLNEIKKENVKTRRNCYLLNKANLAVIVFIFILSAIMGYYLGCNHFSFPF